MCIVAIGYRGGNSWHFMDWQQRDEPIASLTSSQGIVVPNPEAFIDVLISLDASDAHHNLQRFCGELERGGDADRLFRLTLEKMSHVSGFFNLRSLSYMELPCRVQARQLVDTYSHHSRRTCDYKAFVQLFSSCSQSWDQWFVVPPTSTSSSIQKLFMELEKTDDDQKWLEGLIWELAQNKHGTHFSQKIIEECGLASQKIVLKALQGKVLAACNDKWANYVLQKCMECTPCQIWQDCVIKELSGNLVAVASSNFGCRVLERLIDHISMEKITPALEADIFKTRELRSLIENRYGNFVVQRLLEHDDLGKIQQLVVEELCRDLHELTGQEIASKVVDQALIYCKPSPYAQLVEAMIKKNVKCDWKHRYRSFVLKNLRMSLVQVLNDDTNARRENVLKVLKRNQESLGILKLNDAAVKALHDQGIYIPKVEVPERGERSNLDGGLNATGKDRKSRRNRPKKTQVGHSTGD